MLWLMLLGCSVLERGDQGVPCRDGSDIQVQLSADGCEEIVASGCEVEDVSGDQVLDVTFRVRTQPNCAPTSRGVEVTCPGPFEPGDVIAYEELVTLFELLPECEPLIQ